ncbi:hypothetical protein BsWGS_03762 [Bradybaena similaris]
MARYDKVVLLGTGSYGKVWLVDTHNSTTDQKVLKEINLTGLGEKDVEQALTEVTILARCRHTNIIGYSEAFVNKTTLNLSIVMEYAPGGDLHKHITQRRGLYFPNETVLCWFCQLISALSYIHKRGILHRDIKPQNLFLNDRNVLKLGDFGISRILHSETDVAVTFVGTPFYLSPEICKQKPYSYKSDMWSAGCVLYEMCCLRVPFTAINLPSLVTQIESGLYSPLPSHCDELLCYLVNSLLTSDPESRLAADDILVLPVLQECLQRNLEMLPELHQGKTSDVIYRESPPKRLTEAVGKKHHLEADDKKTEAESSSPPRLPGERMFCKNEADVKQDVSRRICSSTYTVVKHPKLRHLSFASPELSAVLERQRTLSDPRRAHSAESPRGTRSKKHRAAPRLNLIQTVKDRKLASDADGGDAENRAMKNISSDMLQNLVEAVYNSAMLESRSHSTVTEIFNLLQMILGRDEIEALIAAIQANTPIRSLQMRFSLQPSVILSALWYLKLKG